MSHAVPSPRPRKGPPPRIAEPKGPVSALTEEDIAERERIMFEVLAEVKRSRRTPA